MVNVSDLRAEAEWVLEAAEKGQGSLSVKLILARLAHPILELLDAMEANKGIRFRTFSEALRESGKTKNYFEKELKSLGGRSRLEAWSQEGFADQTDEGLWLISPIKVAEARGDEDSESDASEHGIDPDALADEFLKSA